MLNINILTDANKYVSDQFEISKHSYLRYVFDIKKLFYHHLK